MQSTGSNVLIDQVGEAIHIHWWHNTQVVVGEVGIGSPVAPQHDVIERGVVGEGHCSGGTL